MKRFCFAVLLVVCLSASALAKDTRIFVDSYINGQPVKLAFDTGAEVPVLFSKSAKRLNISIVKEPPPDLKVEAGKVKLRLSEECKLRMKGGKTECTVQFAVFDVPAPLDTDFDGVLSWSGFKHLMLQFDFSLNRVIFRKKIEFDRSKWKSLDIRKDMDVLVVKTSSKDKMQDSLLIDTGAQGGLMVRKKVWEKFDGLDGDQNTTVSAIYTPGLGLVVYKERWARQVDFGGLTLRHIPIKEGMELDPWMMKEGVDGIVGMWALSCYSWIVDGSAGKIYFKENNVTRVPEKYECNRLGAVFVPKDILKTNELIAHVINGGPAYKAGIRDGDQLLKIGDLDATKWRTNPKVMPMSRFWSKPAGTKKDLTIMRNKKQIKISVKLEEIFKTK